MRQSSNHNAFASEADAAACRALLRGGSRTFFAASLMLPRHVRTPAVGLYAFCRLADDAIDQGSDRELALQDLRTRLDGIYAGAPSDHASDRAFAQVVVQHRIPRAFPDALLEGFEWDAKNRRYEDLSQLHSYGVRVAGTVGAMMAMVMGVRSRVSIARACDLGVAMQLTNIARDVGEDARCGRLYLPLQWMRAAGLDPEAWLAAPLFTEKLKHVIRQVLEAADVLYRRADAGLATLPASCRPAMYAARMLYAEIGGEVARGGYDSVTRRAVVPWPRKARLLADSVLAAAHRRAVRGGDLSNEYRFLLEALGETAAAAQAPAGRQSVEDRVVWLADLFERLERRERSVSNVVPARS